ncbi:MAG TPA: triple tyrosine motif-containing protein, partial [Bacteroidales bacterium]|nr:triple tyrosine motif-containing protein [Bacteroidales bacterium]
QHHPQRANSLSGNYLIRLFMDSRETLWIGTWGGGLNRYNRNTNSFTRFLSDPLDPASLSGNIIHDIYENDTDSGRILLVGTNRGLSVLLIDSVSAGFYQISEKDGLPGSSVYTVLPDDNHNLWISSNIGLTRIQPESGRFRNFTVKDGLQSNEFNAGAKIKLHNGYFMFGGVEGFNIFCPDSIHERSYNPSVAITSFMIFNKETKLPAALPFTSTIQLNYRQNFFSFEFASLDYAIPERNQYRYIMEGLDEDWVEAGTRRYAGYTGLDPGEYIFRVQGTNSDGVWSDQEASMNIIITPPWWKTWWFRILGILAGVVLLYLIHLYRLQQVRQIERLRVRIASDLHDDLGAVLTRITIHSQQIETSRDTEQALSISHKIAELSRQIISTLSDIIWSIDARNDTLGDLLARMQDVAHNTLPARDISVTFQHKGLNMKKRLKVTTRQHIYYIFKEAITNIAKHSGAKQVLVKFISDENGFELSVSDDGKGINAQNTNKGNGLRNMKMRAGRMGVELTIHTADKGTEIRLRGKKI